MKLTRQNFCRFYSILILYTLLFNFAPFSSARTDKHEYNQNENVNLSSVYFEENRGQFDKSVRYISRVNGQTIFLTANEIVYVLQSPKSKVQSPRSGDTQISDKENPKSEIRNLKGLLL